MVDNSLKYVIQNLEDLFQVLNSKFFEGELAKPVITVSPNTAKISSLGWCTQYKVWQDRDGDEGYFEINICAEHLARPFGEVAGTMLHEMVHLYNLQNGVKDTSRGGTYHNKRFREAAEAHGLTVEETEKYGWTKTDLTEEARTEVEDFMSFIGKDSFEIFRKPEEDKPKKGGSKSSSRKYVCPCCGLIVRATKEVKVVCFDCNEILREEL